MSEALGVQAEARQAMVELAARNLVEGGWESGVMGDVVAPHVVGAQREWVSVAVAGKETARAKDCVRLNQAVSAWHRGGEHIRGHLPHSSTKRRQYSNNDETPTITHRAI